MKHLLLFSEWPISILAVLVFFLCFSSVGCTQKPNQKKEAQPRIKLTHDKIHKEIDVTVEGQPFTSYIYSDTIPVLKKTVLWPIYSADGAIITRSYPLHPQKGERVDHPHHIGLWLNYGNVNGLDFWNNSDAIPEDRVNEMGIIRNHSIDLVESGDDDATLKVTEHWLKPGGETLLVEKTTFVFRAGANFRIIDRATTLTALDQLVSFKDDKEGMLGMRMTRALEYPSDKPIVLTDAHGNKTTIAVKDNSGVTGYYINSEGVEGMDVWGKRAKWCSLSGTVGGKDVDVVIFDHPDNVGYPTYWHARGYGLFAANPLGQAIFSNGEEKLNFVLEPGQSVTFKYRILILSQKPDVTGINKAYETYLKEVK